MTLPVEMLAKYVPCCHLLHKANFLPLDSLLGTFFSKMKIKSFISFLLGIAKATMYSSVQI